MPVTVLDIEQHLLLLELQAPFDKRDVQLARRRMAKRWHPDVAPPGRQLEHGGDPQGEKRGRAATPEMRSGSARLPPAESAKRRAGGHTKRSSAPASTPRTGPRTTPSAAG